MSIPQNLRATLVRDILLTHIGWIIVWVLWYIIFFYVLERQFYVPCAELEKNRDKKKRQQESID
jgi:hypothetical protein